MKISIRRNHMSIHYVALVFAAAVLFLIITVLSGCALETPKVYAKIPNTPYSAYVYAGGGIADTESPDAPDNQ